MYGFSVAKDHHVRIIVQYIHTFYAFQKLEKHIVIMINRKLLSALCSVYLKKRMTSKHQVNTTSSTSSQFENGFYCRIIYRYQLFCGKKIPDSSAFVNFPIEKVLKKIHSVKAVANKQNSPNRSHRKHSE